MSKILVILLCFAIALVSCLPPRPDFPIDDLCDKYREKCASRGKNIFCKQRTEECRLYASKGLDIAWSFCMFSNTDDLVACNKRIQIDYEIITNTVRDDKFKYDFAY
ncbi:unnamed protein product [Auanema sp. JU1783]|nr:unnamed protein product [Auanema sp. JU1783]